MTDEIDKKHYKNLVKTKYSEKLEKFNKLRIKNINLNLFSSIFVWTGFIIVGNWLFEGTKFLYFVIVTTIYYGFKTGRIVGKQEEKYEGIINNFMTAERILQEKGERKYNQK